MKKIALLTLAACTLLSVFSPALPAQEEDRPVDQVTRQKNVRIEAEAGLERSFLYTQYQIGGEFWARDDFGYLAFPISELRFPLDVYMMYANLNLTFFNRIGLHGRIKTNLNDPSAPMKDTDWDADFGLLRTTYSESDVKLKALVSRMDLSVRLFTVNFFTVKMGAGFDYQKFSFRCSNVRQVDIGYDPGYPLDPSFIALPGKTLNYDVKYYMFSLFLQPVFSLGRHAEIGLSIRYAPYVRAKDIDDHLLRYKKSVGDSSGMSSTTGLTARYTFDSRVFITLGMEYVFIKTTGNQKQSYYWPSYENDYLPGWAFTLENELESHQLSLGLGVGYSFEF